MLVATTKRARFTVLAYLQRQLPVALFVSLVVATLLTVLISLIGEQGRSELWWGLMVAVCVGRYIVYYRDRAVDEGAHKRALLRFRVGSLAAAALWGSTAFLLADFSNPMSVLLLAFVLGGMTSAGVVTLSGDLLSAMGFAGLTLLPLALRSLFWTHPIGSPLSVFFIVYVVGMALVARQVNEHLMGALTLRADREVERLRLRDFVEGANDLIQMTDPQGRILYANSAWRRALGYDNYPLHHLSLADIIAPSHLEDCQRKLARLLTGEDLEAIETVFLTRDGKELPVEGNIGLYTEDGEFVSTRGIFRDITARKVAEKAQNEHLRARDAFFANISHELRTPLNAILGTCEVMVKGTYGDLTQVQRERVEIVADCGRHLLALINDILDLSRIRAGQLVLEREAMDLRAECARLIPMIEHSLREKWQHLEFDPDGALVVGDVDPRRFRQIVINLLANATRFTPEGGTIGLDLKALEGTGNVQLVIWDTGVGIPPEDRQRVFEPFVQAHIRTDGTGLGLSLVAQLAKLHGGTVELSDHPSGGARFSITLPAGEAIRAVTMPEPQKVVPGQQIELEHSMRVLLVDDNTTNVIHLRDYLQARGHSVLVSTTGVDAIRQTREYEPDAVFMDILMPDMSGLDVIKEIRRGAVRDIFIVALTALTTSSDEQICRTAGADAFVSKPFTLAQVESVLKDAADRSPPAPT